MVRVLGLVSLFSLVLSVAFHVATFVPMLPDGLLGLSFLLHFVTLILGSVAIGMFALHRRQPTGSSNSGLLEQWRIAIQNETRLRERVIRCVPLRFLLASILAFAYAVANIVRFAVVARQVEPAVRDVVRFFSGFWIVFLLLATIYFLVVHPQLVSPEPLSGKED